jgi:hypothetical protein
VDPRAGLDILRKMPLDRLALEDRLAQQHNKCFFYLFIFFNVKQESIQNYHAQQHHVVHTHIVLACYSFHVMGRYHLPVAT